MKFREKIFLWEEILAGIYFREFESVRENKFVHVFPKSSFTKINYQKIWTPKKEAIEVIEMAKNVRSVPIHNHILGEYGTDAN